MAGPGIKIMNCITTETSSFIFPLPQMVSLFVRIDHMFVHKRRESNKVRMREVKSESRMRLQIDYLPPLQSDTNSSSLQCGASAYRWVPVCG